MTGTASARNLVLETCNGVSDQVRCLCFQSIGVCGRRRRYDLGLLAGDLRFHVGRNASKKVPELFHVSGPRGFW